MSFPVKKPRYGANSLKSDCSVLPASFLGDESMSVGAAKTFSAIPILCQNRQSSPTEKLTNKK